jgi:hypothetical protein
MEGEERRTWESIETIEKESFYTLEAAKKSPNPIGKEG